MGENGEHRDMGSEDATGLNASLGGEDRSHIEWALPGKETSTGKLGMERKPRRGAAPRQGASLGSHAASGIGRGRGQRHGRESGQKKTRIGLRSFAKEGNRAATWESDRTEKKTCRSELIGGIFWKELWSSLRTPGS
jgi:hypothetical protein